ncbi:MAG TPA: SDR family oxidoreductase [Burkholderiales bacterium]|nr:SDR family oxidoreductase [Burkholderiales bacterium]
MAKAERVARAHGDLAGKVALVTGASRGIGRAIAERLAGEGAFVFVNFRSARRDAAACVDAICAAGGAAEAIRADISHQSQVRRMFAHVRKRSGRLDILVGNAGVAPIATDVAQVTPKMWHRTFAVNVTGAFLCAQAALPLLRRSDAGRIIFIGSAASRLGGTIGPHYAAAKAAISGLVEYLSRALGGDGITVNVVEPGFVATALSARLHRKTSAVRAMKKTVPLGRVGTVNEIAAAVAFLAGRNAGYITRQHLAVTGGR